MSEASFARMAIAPGFDPYSGHSDTGWFGSKLVKKVGQLAKRAVHDVTHPKDFVKDSYSVAKAAVPAVQMVIKNMGPIGMVASGALGAMKAGLSGQNLESIAWAAAKGAAPTGIDRAIGAAEQLRHGKSVISIAMNQAAGHFIPGSSEAVGFAAGVAALKNQASKAGLGEVRRALVTEGSKRAFDAAIGTAATIAEKKGLVRRPGIPVISMAKPRGKISTMSPNLKAVVDSLHRNPGLMSQDPQVLAQKFSTNAATINDALGRVGNKQMLPWRSMSPRAINFVRRYNPHAPLIALRHAHTDTAGLDQTGTKYIVEKGDGPWAIAQKLTGNGNRWKELLDVNKDKKPTVDKNIWVGEPLNLPLSWQKPAASKGNPSTPALPAVPLPSIAPIPSTGTATPNPIFDITPSVVQGKSILVAWSKTDGINQAGLTDYGLNVADLSTTMGPRDTLELASFQVWNNKTLGSNLNIAGSLDPATLAALQAWAEARAAAAVPANVVVSPSTTVPALPGIVPVTPTQIIPTVIGGTDSTQKPVTPAVKPAAPGSSIGMMAMGAVIGGLLFGVPGAAIGAAGGAAIS